MVHPDLLASTPIPHLLWALAANDSQRAQFPRALSLVKGGHLAPRFLTAHSQGLTYMGDKSLASCFTRGQTLWFSSCPELPVGSGSNRSPAETTSLRSYFHYPVPRPSFPPCNVITIKITSQEPDACESLSRALLLGNVIYDTCLRRWTLTGIEPSALFVSV